LPWTGTWSPWRPAPWKFAGIAATPPCSLPSTPSIFLLSRTKIVGLSSSFGHVAFCFSSNPSRGPRHLYSEVLQKTNYISESDYCHWILQKSFYRVLPCRGCTWKLSLLHPSPEVQARDLCNGRRWCEAWTSHFGRLLAQCWYIYYTRGLTSATGMIELLWTSGPRFLALLPLTV
jgi:hypothetical protein